MRPPRLQVIAGVFLGVLRIADLQRHLHHFFRSPAVGRALQRADAGDHRRVQIGNGGGGYPGSEGRGVGPVLCVENEVHVQQAGSLFVGNLAEHHVEKVAGVIEFRVGGDGLQPLPQTMMRRDDGRPLRGEADPLADGGLGGVVGHLCHVVTSQRRNACAQGVHRVGVLHHFQHRDDAVGDAAAGPQLDVEVGQLLLRGQAAVEQQVDDFLEGGFFGQVVDVVATV